MSFKVPLIVRGQVIESDLVEYGGRREAARFRAPALASHLSALVLEAPSRMADLYQISFDEIVTFLGKLGARLDPDRNTYLQEAFELSRLTSGLSEPILRHHYRQIPGYFEPRTVRELAERLIGMAYLEGWVEQPAAPQDISRLRIRAFGARAVHVIAGNVPVVGATTVIRNAVTRSDAIVKAPSNDPLTTAAIVRTMIDMAADHPLTRHISVAYWKGGDSEIEEYLYDPRRIEKIIAWGGFAGIQSVKRYLQPGLDLITLDPKHSSSLIGREAFESSSTLQSVAQRLALDIGGLNQEGCVNARVIYVESGTDAVGIERADQLGALTFAALQSLPDFLSTPHKAFDPELKAELDALSLLEDEYRVFGGRRNEGAVIVSRSSQPVDFARQLACRVGNLVPVDSLETAVRSVNAYTQTIGIYPESLKESLRDRLALHGAQRLVSLGAATLHQHPGPQDGIEPLRRMVKWITEETFDGRRLDETVAGRHEV